MIKTLTIISTLGISLAAFAAAPATAPADKPAAINTECPITGKPANPKCNLAYEDTTYAFCSGDCRKKFQADRDSSLYQQLGGKAAIDAAVELFYVKVLADDRVKHFFDDVSMAKQKRKQKAFLSAALGAPVKWDGKDMRKAHADMKLNDTHFNAIAEHLQATLVELKVSKELIDRVLAVVETTRADVLNRPKSS